jgi:hypothetical protein
MAPENARIYISIQIFWAGNLQHTAKTVGVPGARERVQMILLSSNPNALCVTAPKYAQVVEEPVNAATAGELVK